MIFADGGSSGSGPQTPPPTQPPAPTPPTPPEPQPGADAIPRSRFNEVNDRAKALEAERDDMRKRLDALEAEKLSDTEKAQREAASEKSKREGAEGRAKAAERKLYVTLAATKAGVDAEIAVALLADAEIESDDQATDAVTKLVERKPELAGTAGGGGAPTAFGRPAGGNAPPPPSGGSGGNGGSVDPKREIGAGLLAAMTGRRGGQ